MKKVGIVMDSTGYLPRDILEQYQIRVVSLNVNFAEETIPETELTIPVYLEKAKHLPGLPTTSQPSVGTFLEAYNSLFAEGFEEIISMHLSAGISGTIHAAEMAREMVSGPKIHIYDSESSALGLGLLAWAAAEWAAERDWSAAQIMDRLPRLKQQMELYFVVDTLENLRKGGRIGGATALVGSLLQIKPILYFNRQAYIDVFDKVRSRGKAWQRVLEELNRALTSGKRYRVCIMHLDMPEEGNKLLQEMQERLPEHEIRLVEAGAVIATHLGRGAFGLAFHPWPFP